KARWRLFGPQPISLVLFLLIVITLVPALLFSVLLLRRSNEAQQDVVITLAETAAVSINKAVDRELVSMMTTLKVLSTANSLGAGNMQDLYARAHSTLEEPDKYLVV